MSRGEGVRKSPNISEGINGWPRTQSLKDFLQNARHLSAKIFFFSLFLQEAFPFFDFLAPLKKKKKERQVEKKSKVEKTSLFGNVNGRGRAKMVIT